MTTSVDTTTITSTPVIPTVGFHDRRAGAAAGKSDERRQFGNSLFGLSPDARELAEAIDGYKLRNRRRYITFEEMLTVIQSLGYSKQL